MCSVSPYLYPSEVIVVSNTDPDPDINWWIESLKLYDSDRISLNSESELTDNIIGAAQTILRRQFPNIQRFQDTFLAHSLNFSPVLPDKCSVQMLHTGK